MDFTLLPLRLIKDYVSTYLHNNYKLLHKIYITNFYIKVCSVKVTLINRSMLPTTMSSKQIATRLSDPGVRATFYLFL